MMSTEKRIQTFMVLGSQQPGQAILPLGTISETETFYLK